MEDSIIITNTTESTVSRKWTTFTLLRAVALILLILTTIVGNSVVIFAIIFSKKLRAILPTAFIANLAFADLLVGLVAIPLHFIVSIVQSWPFDIRICKISTLVNVLSCAASMFSLCAIAFDRYMGVTRPLTSMKIMTRKVNVIVIILVWLLSAMVGAGPNYLWPVQTDTSITLPNCKQEINQGLEPHVPAYFAAWFLIPFSIMIGMYWRIYIKLSERQRGLRNGSVSSIRVHTNPAYFKFRSEKQAAKMLAIVLGAFIICWLPYIAFSFILAIGVDLGLSKLDLYNLFTWLRYLGYFNSCVNPFIYAANSKSFRLVFSRLLKCKRF